MDSALVNRIDTRCRTADGAAVWLEAIAIDALGGDADMRRLLPIAVLHYLRCSS